MGFLFSYYFSPPLGHARRELGLSFLPSFLFSFLNGFGSVVYYLILGERGRGESREELSVVRCLLSPMSNISFIRRGICIV